MRASRSPAGKFTPELPGWAQDVLATLPPLLSRDLAAKTMGVSKKTIDRLVRAGVLTTVRSGTRVLIPRLALVEHLVLSS